MNTRTKQLVGIGAVIVLIVALILIFSNRSDAATGDDCVPVDAYTETIDHPAGTHEVTVTVVDVEAYDEVVHHDAVTHVVHHDAVTHVVHHEAVPAGPNNWWNWSPNDTKGPQDYEPAFPVDERGTWQGPHENGGPDQDTFGTFNSSHGASGNSSWFHREHGTPGVDAWDETVVDQEAYDETVVDSEAYDETVHHDAVTHEETSTVTDTEPWTETIEHDAVACDEPPTDNPPTDTPPVVTHDPAPPKAPVVPTVVHAGL